MKHKKQNLANRLEELNERKIEEICEPQESHQKGLESPAAQFERQKQQIKDFYKNCTDSMSQAFQIIIEKLVAANDFETINELLQGAKRLKNQISKLSDQEILDFSYLDNQNLASLCGYNEELINKLYQIGVTCLESKDLSHAAKIFTLIILLDPGYSSVWITLGITLEQEKKWNEALDIFDIAISLDAENPLPYWHKAICYKESGLKKEAKKAQDEAHAKALADAKYAEFAESIKNEKI